jgi:alpha-N-arabinofuranosidase
VQKLFSTNRGTELLSINKSGKPVTGEDGIYASAVRDAGTGEIIIKIVNASDKEQDTSIELNGARKVASKGNIISLGSRDLQSVNSFEDPAKIKPVTNELQVKGQTVKLRVAPYSLSVIKIKAS